MENTKNFYNVILVALPASFPFKTIVYCFLLIIIRYERTVVIGIYSGTS